MGNSNIGFQFFADAGTLVNATGNYVNAYDGTKTQFDATNKLTPTMKTFYDTQLLENARPELIFAQLAKKQALPRNHGKSVEWRKWNTLPEAETLTEGVIPTGQKLGMSSMTQDLVQKGLYVTISDLLELHAIDNAILGATEELGASGGMSIDKMVRNEVVGGTVKQLCDKVNATTGEHTEVTVRSGMDTTCVLTPTEVNKAVTTLKKAHAPTINGKYVGIIHPSVAFDLRQSKEWIEAHKYAAVTELFNGEIGELHGVRFIESTNQKIWNDDTCPVKTAAGSGKPAVYYSVYATIIMGKDAFAMIDPDGGTMEMIVKTKGEAGGPLEQFSTVGYKYEGAAKRLYEERMVRIESTSAYSPTDQAN